MTGGRVFAWLVLLLVPSCGRGQEFRWIDSQGQARSANKPDEIPRGEWGTVTTEVRGAEATSGERFRTAEGLTVVIEGIQAPAVDDDGTAVSSGGARARARLDELIKNLPLTLEFEGDRRLPDGEFLAHPVREDGKLLAEILLEEGLVRLCLEDDAMRHAASFRAAQAVAKKAQKGVWGKPAFEVPPDPPVYRGVGLGLYAQDPEFDYTGFLDEIRDVGASHVLIPSPWLMEDWQSNDFGPVRGRTAGWPALQRMTRQAHERGLSLGYLPLVLLRTGTVEHWRGDIQPTQRWLWYRNYNRYIGRWADMARDLGVPLLCVGSEYSSLERETSAWRNIIANVRARYEGRLTYSANWDHLDVPGFWNDLDVIGVTGYFSLTSKDDPTVEEIVAAWGPIKDKLLRFQAAAGQAARDHRDRVREPGRHQHEPLELLHAHRAGQQEPQDRARPRRAGRLLPRALSGLERRPGRLQGHVPLELVAARGAEGRLRVLGLREARVLHREGVLRRAQAPRGRRRRNASRRRGREPACTGRRNPTGERQVVAAVCSKTCSAA